MAVLIVGRYLPEVYYALTDDEREAGKIAARRIFGYDEQESEHDKEGKKEEKKEGKKNGKKGDKKDDDYEKGNYIAGKPGYERYAPVAGVRFHYVDAFRRSQPGDTAIGWVAIVTDDTYRALIDELGWPNGPLCHIYDLQIIALENAPDTYAVYEHMTPAHWGVPSS